jgi:predicted amidohydrolase
MRSSLITALLLVAVHLQPCASAIKVAAGQVNSTTGASAAETQNLNVDTFLQLMSQAVFQGATFIDFPEFSLMGSFEFDLCSANFTVGAFGEVIGAAGQAIDCNASGPLSSIGCSDAAKVLHVSYNTVENADGVYYNTQVVVHDGTIVARYRKYNVFYKNCFASPQLELVTFVVQNTTFGIFTCYDILFEHPKMDLVKAGVKYFSYSSAIPIIGADAVSLFGAENAVNVVSSNANTGQSSIVDHGLTIARAPSGGNYVVVATLA